MNDNLKHHKLKIFLFSFLDYRIENGFLDMKLKWHNRIENFIKDIICFSNTVHDRNSLLMMIFK